MVELESLLEDCTLDILPLCLVLPNDMSELDKLWLLSLDLNEMEDVRLGTSGGTFFTGVDI